MNTTIFQTQQSFDVNNLPTRCLFAFFVSVFVTLPMAVWETHWWVILGLTFVYTTFRQTPQFTCLAVAGYLFSTACSAGLYFWAYFAARVLEHVTKPL